MKEKWLRVRFHSDNDDPRPIYEPPALPEGPYWITGYDAEDNAILVAYVKSEETVERQWPEAFNVEIEVRDEITFTDRFPKPDWWVIK